MSKPVKVTVAYLSKRMRIVPVLYNQDKTVNVFALERRNKHRPSEWNVLGLYDRDQVRSLILNYFDPPTMKSTEMVSSPFFAQASAERTKVGTSPSRPHRT